MKTRYVAVFPSPWLLTPEALACAVEHYDKVMVTFDIGMMHEDLQLFRRAHSIFELKTRRKCLKALDDTFPIRYLSDAPVMRVIDAERMSIVRC